MPSFNNIISFSHHPQVLLELAKVLFEEQSTLSSIVRRIMELTLSLLRCDRCSILLVDDSSKVTKNKHRFYFSFFVACSSIWAVHTNNKKTNKIDLMFIIFTKNYLHFLAIVMRSKYLLFLLVFIYANFPQFYQHLSLISSRLL